MLTQVNLDVAFCFVLLAYTFTFPLTTALPSTAFRTTRGHNSAGVFPYLHREMPIIVHRLQHDHCLSIGFDQNIFALSTTENQEKLSSAQCPVLFGSLDGSYCFDCLKHIIKSKLDSRKTKHCFRQTGPNDWHPIRLRVSISLYTDRRPPPILTFSGALPSAPRLASSPFYVQLSSQFEQPDMFPGSYDVQKRCVPPRTVET